jgi:hypothetical protein
MKRVLAFAACAFAVFAGCKAKKAPGELVVAIDTDLTPGVDFDELQVEVVAPAGTSSFPPIKEFGQRSQPYSFPMTFALVSNGDPSTKVQIRVAAGLSTIPGGHSAVGMPLLLREVTTTIPDDRVALLRVHLEWLCVGYAKQNPAPDTYVEGNCPVDGLTCVAGECVDFKLESSTFPDYDEALVFGGGHAGAGDGTCFDTLGCFAGAVATTPDPSCTIPMPSGERSKVNVGLVSARCEGGVCPYEGDRCVVPLDTASPGGWTEIGGRIHLPPAACRKTSGVLVSTSCATKTAGVPTCGPWSEILTPAGTFTTGVPAVDAGAGACADAGVD